MKREILILSGVAIAAAGVAVVMHYRHQSAKDAQPGESEQKSDFEEQEPEGSGGGSVSDGAGSGVGAITSAKPIVDGLSGITNDLVNTQSSIVMAPETQKDYGLPNVQSDLIPVRPKPASLASKIDTAAKKPFVPGSGFVGPKIATGGTHKTAIIHVKPSTTKTSVKPPISKTIVKPATKILMNIQRIAPTKARKLSADGMIMIQADDFTNGHLNW